MTEKEQQLIENLTKQLEINNQLAMKESQPTSNSILWNERINTAECALLDAKENLCKSATWFINILSAGIIIFMLVFVILLFAGVNILS